MTFTFPHSFAVMTMKRWLRDLARASIAVAYKDDHLEMESNHR